MFPEQPLFSHSANIRKYSEVNTAQYMAQKYNIICTESASSRITVAVGTILGI